VFVRQLYQCCATEQKLWHSQYLSPRRRNKPKPSTAQLLRYTVGLYRLQESACINEKARRCAALLCCAQELTCLCLPRPLRPHSRVRRAIDPVLGSTAAQCSCIAPAHRSSGSAAMPAASAEGRSLCDLRDLLSNEHAMRARTKTRGVGEGDRRHHSLLQPACMAPVPLSNCRSSGQAQTDARIQMQMSGRVGFLSWEGDVWVGP
jgi:hypothetical protein